MTEQPGQKPEQSSPGEAAPGAVQQEQPDEQRTEEETDSPQDAWAARRELYFHSPTAFGGSLVGGNQTGVSGGSVAGDVVMGTKFELHYRFGASSHTSGDIPGPELEQRAKVFAGYEELVAPLVDRLRDEKVLVLSGAPFSGRHSAALMLLHALEAVPVRALDPKTKR